ncbi:MAG: isoprenyl transferase [Planctomycetota bacterium]
MLILPKDIDPVCLPKHIAIIMDGNGRWARSRGMRRSQGHSKGAERVRPTVEACKDIGIKYITLYAFSSENWKRSALERNFLWRLLVHFVRKELPDLMKEGVRFNVIGSPDALPEFARKELARAMQETRGNEAITLTLAINYGGRNEIIRAAKRWCKDVVSGKARLDSLDEVSFSSYLDTSDLPDPDLLIRTAGELRLSNFLLWQLSYSEIYVTNTYWPDFNEEALLDAIRSFQKRVRRMGGVPVEEENP